MAKSRKIEGMTPKEAAALAMMLLASVEDGEDIITDRLTLATVGGMLLEAGAGIQPNHLKFAYDALKQERIREQLKNIDLSKLTT